MIYVLDEKGNLKQAARREPTAPHWNIYRKVRRELPDLCGAMYETIAEAVGSGEFYNAGRGEFRNSTWIGKRILTDWDRKAEWDRFCGDEDTSSALFGEIMWTYMWDDSKAWCTTKTTTANVGREERVYFSRD